MAAVDANDSASSLMADVQQQLPQIRACADEAEAQRRLSDDLVQAMQAAGLYRMWVPQEFAGSEVDPLSAMRVVEELSRADGSVAWCLMAHIQNTWGLAPRLTKPVAAEVYADPDVVVAAANQPRGQAVVVDGGYRVTSR